MKKQALFIGLLLASLLMSGCQPLLGLEDWSFLGGEESLVSSKEIDAELRCEQGTASSVGITDLVIFGDSLSDTNHKNKGRLQLNPEWPFFLGRFSNGPIWNDYLAQCANLSVDNYSRGGAVTRAHVGEPTEELFGYLRELGRSLAIGSIDQFVDEYLKEHNHLIPRAHKTLFVIWAGANDYLSKFDNTEDLNTMIDEPDAPHKGANAIARMSVRNLGEEIRKLYDCGARKIIVGNLPDMGLMPTIHSNKNYRRDLLNEDERHYRLSQELSRISTFHNELLAAHVEEIKNSLNDESVTIAIFDAAQSLKNLLNNSGPHGEEGFDFGIDLKKSFKTLKLSNKKPISIGQKCYLGGYLGSTDEKKVCANPEKMLFWDDIHPTSAGHCWLAYFLHSFLNDQNIIRPLAKFKEYQKLCK